jgi:predicted RNA-binding Zn-ribbon protein involved in translation (DUF1610 family)
MSKSLRLSETWFRRFLWAIAVVFAWFLLGLGAHILADLPKIENKLSLQQFIDPVALRTVQDDIRKAELSEREATDALEQARLKHNASQANTDAEKETFMAWVATRQATEAPAQNIEVTRRTERIENFQALERVALAQVEAQQKILLDSEQALREARSRLNSLEESAQSDFQSELFKQELRVFGLRLLFALPLVLAAGWLYKHKRKSTYWPFVWGFVFFALFVFFVELVPYLPSYGGYIRYLVGIALTVLIGQQAIRRLNLYLEQQKLAEAQPEAQRRESLQYDAALALLAKGVCPGCERHVDLKDPKIDFCPHCGLGLYQACSNCNTRKSTFSKYCHSCGATSLSPDNVTEQGT